jgi:hypothetical protein
MPCCSGRPGRLASTVASAQTLGRTQTLMRELEVHLSIHEPLAEFEASLEGCVFHVTNRAHWPAILASGAISPNTDGQLPTTFGSSRNSYFRNRACVSLFDYRDPPDEDIHFSRSKRWPLQPEARSTSGLTFAFLSPQSYARLIPWTNWKLDGAPQEMIVPHIEVGHPGPIPLADIELVTHLLVDEDPNSLGSRLRNARQRRSAA